MQASYAYGQEYAAGFSGAGWGMGAGADVDRAAGAYAGAGRAAGVQLSQAAHAGTGFALGAQSGRFASVGTGRYAGGVGDSMRDNRHTLPDDLLLRRYRVMGSCGTGGFGTVLACWDTRLQRRVAIKRIRLAHPVPPQADGYPQAGGYPAAGAYPAGTAPTLANASTIDEALGEARTASRLSHPGIVGVHDFVVESGVAYLVMEYVDGLTLTELLGRVEGGRLTHDEAAYLVQRLGEAIGFAHREGVLHLDIKPSNIMFARDGSVKLCDFGMATLASATGYADARGGTVGYMPPEQVEDGLVDERTDVFGMAVSLTQALTGTNPFAAQTAEQSCSLIRRGPKPKLSRLDPGLGGMAEETLLACLAADPSLRPPDASAVANDLAFGLGDPDDGALSIKDLLSQLDGEVDDTAPEWAGERLPLAYRYPRLASWIQRWATAAVAAVLAFQLVPLLSLPVEVPRRLAALVVAMASALWTPAAGLAGGALVVAALVTGANASGVSAAYAVAVLMGFALFIWWVTHLHDRTAALSLLTAAAFGQPAAAPAVATATMRPVGAAVTTALAAALAAILRTSLAAQQPVPGPGLPLDLDLLAATFAPVRLIALGGTVVAALAGSLVSWPHESTGRVVAGQLICCGATVFFQLFALRMENGGIWPTPTWETVGVAVVLGVLVCLAAGISGPRDADREG